LCLAIAKKRSQIKISGKKMIKEGLVGDRDEEIEDRDEETEGPGEEIEAGEDSEIGKRKLIAF
jgi:hypothetical protein